MHARCPKNPEHKEFVTVATVAEDWVVDETGAFIEVADPPDGQVVHGPDSGNVWSCRVCGAEAVVTNP